jgi:hypothetical protein
MTIKDVVALTWVRNRKNGNYVSVHYEHEPWFYLIEKAGHRWVVGRIRFRNKKLAKWEPIPGAPERCERLLQAQAIAATDYEDHCIPAMEASWTAGK